MIVTRALLATLLLAFMGCQQSPEQAHQQLGRLDIQFDREVFIDSIRKGNVVVVKLFLASGMDPNTEVRYANDEDTERSALDMFLQEAGIDFRIKGTVLHLAARLKLPLVVRTLLDAGADANAEDDAEKRAIDYVDEQTEVYELLRQL